MYGISDPLSGGMAATSAGTSLAGTGLAFTGAHVVGLVLLGVGLLCSGLTLLTLARRRRHAHS
jgi:hypothetical protein